MCMIGNHVNPQGFRGFESLPLRHFDLEAVRANPLTGNGIWCYLPRFKYHVTYTIRGQSIRIFYVRYARKAPLTSFGRT
jgi:hypothetical protein